MPAIKITKRGESATLLLTHYQFKNGPYQKLEIVSNNSIPVDAILEGFICTQGSKYIEGAILVKAHAVAITNGDGSPGDEWRILPEGQFVYCMMVEKFMPSRHYCYVLVDDNGWPMVAPENPRHYIAGETEYEGKTHISLFGSALRG